ncbi:MAG: 50S ribosomal protein L10 [Candidatus Binataceae bacterium]
MNKQQKTALVEDLRAGFGRASLALVSEYKGMTAGESADMRRRLRAARGELRVAKNTLVRRAIEGTQYASLGDKLGGPVGLILSFEDPVEMAKTVVGFKDLGEKFKIRGGVLAGQALTAEEIQALATLPPKEVILAQLLGVLQAPATQLVRLLNEPGSMLARAIDAIGKKNGEGTPTASAPEAPAAPAEEAPAGR